MWKIFQNIWARGRVKACTIKANKYEGILFSDSCVLIFGGLNDNIDGGGIPTDTGIPGHLTAVGLLHDGWIDLSPTP
ncbi:MAG: hypothetical protein MUP55_02765 [Candidatus Aenigmarchaeota archaeon]|nr:hypothetical protein [Candidatus Aenigmarchaeota archaeon]